MGFLLGSKLETGSWKLEAGNIIQLRVSSN